jgi:UDP-N-acetylglucosamine 1-carboxyvinyltransferase
MEKFVIKGGVPLQGSVAVNGAKNAALPIVAACLLTAKPVSLKCIPKGKDVYTMLKVLKELGSSYSWTRDTLTIHAKHIISTEAPYDLVKKMRASYYVLGPLLSRCKKARVSLPGGCALGQRPIDLHVKGLRALGVKVDLSRGYVNCSASALKGTRMNLKGLRGSSVGATTNIMMAATLSQGITTIDEAAKEPEVVDVANFLNACGADISGMGTSIIQITGKKRLHGCEYSIIPDRIEAGTLLMAAAITKGKVTLKKCCAEHLGSLITLLREYGATVRSVKQTVTISSPRKGKPLSVLVGPYPAFPTDLQPPMTALLSVTPGNSTIVETIFENRFMHVPELVRLGADINLIDRYTAIIKGVKQFEGAPVMASDIQGSTALILAALAAKGETHISRIYHTDRRYVHIEKKLAKLGARIKRVHDPAAP